MLFPLLFFIRVISSVLVAILYAPIHIDMQYIPSWRVFPNLWGFPGLYRATTDLNQLLNVCMVDILVLYVFQFCFYIASLSMPTLSYTGCDTFVFFFTNGCTVLFVVSLCSSLPTYDSPNELMFL